MGRSSSRRHNPGSHRWRARARRTAPCSTCGSVRQHSGRHHSTRRFGWHQPAEQLWWHHPACHFDAGSNHDAVALTFRDGYPDAHTDSYGDPDPNSYSNANANRHSDTDTNTN